MNTTNTAADLDTLTMEEALCLYGLMSADVTAHDAAAWLMIATQLGNALEQHLDAPAGSRQAVADRIRDCQGNAVYVARLAA
jgi:hypothetical protein